MKDNGKKEVMLGLILLAGFVVWTLLIRNIDVQRAGPNESEIGFAKERVYYD